MSYLTNSKTEGKDLMENGGRTQETITDLYVNKTLNF